MSSAQKIIKYFAIGFAFFIIISIITGIIIGINIITLKLNEDNSIMDNMKKTSVNVKPSILKINIGASKLIIKNGEVFSVETNNKHIKIKENETTLLIQEEKNTIINSSKSEVILYIPNDHSFSLIDMEAGAGNIFINSLIADEMELELGAGNVNIDYLQVLKSLDIDGGAGNINFKEANVNNLDFDLGVGNVTLNGSLIGNTDIDAGVGNLDIKLNGTRNDYTIKVNKGVGSIKINQEAVKNKTVYGQGINTVNIDGGIGSIDINLAD